MWNKHAWEFFVTLCYEHPLSRSTFQNQKAKFRFFESFFFSSLIAQSSFSSIKSDKIYLRFISSIIIMSGENALASRRKFGQSYRKTISETQKLGIRLVGRHRQTVDLSILMARIPGRHE